MWKILGQYQSYNVNAKRRLLYLNENEKLQISIYRGNNMINMLNMLSAQISQKQDGHYIYAIMKTMCPLSSHHNGSVATHALVHNCTSCA